MIENFAARIEETIRFLPPLPPTTSDLIALLGNDDVDFRAIGEVISRDPAMAVNVLRIANSVYFGLSQKILTIDQAVRMLGTTEIASLCISCGASRTLTPPPGVKTVDLNRFWRHSVATAVIAKFLSERLDIGHRDHLYLAGLVHDAGALVIDRCSHDLYARILDLTGEHNIPMEEAEECTIGLSHDVVGGLLMEQWHLPEVFVETARHHHHPSQALESHRTVVALVSLADLLARLTQHGFDGNMNGVFVEETEQFRILQASKPDFCNLDVVKLVWDLDAAKEDIEELQAIVNQ